MRPRNQFVAAFMSCAFVILLAGCDDIRQSPPVQVASDAADTVPEWAKDAVFYQIFPERFRNGDPTNDPTHASLEFPENVPENWEVTPWTADWYARADWEKARGEDFYEDGVFDRRLGGDLQGVLDKLDYLKNLGINTIYFNPVFYARSLHKYDGSSFHHIDPYFGPDPEGDLALMAAENALEPAEWTWTAADSLFLNLLREAHARDLRIIIDGVFNHTGLGFFAFKNIQENQQASPYADWYVIKAWDDPATEDNEFDHEGWWGYKPLPVFADNADQTDLHPGPKQYVMDATARWMDPDGDGDPSDGIDGWRLDVANEVPVGFWADWNAHVRRLNPDAYTVTEIWEDAGDYLREGGFSATMNYYGFAFPVKGFLIEHMIGDEAFAEMLNERRNRYPEPVQHALQNLIDSHDTDRLASMIVNAGKQTYSSGEASARFGYDWGDNVSPRRTDQYLVRAPNETERQIQRLVALFQMTYVGAPMIYYGTEAGMWGADDPDDRKPMLWEDLNYDAESADPLGRPRAPDAVAFDAAMFAFYRDVIAFRHAHPALRSGTFEVVDTEADDVFAFSRQRGEERLYIYINRSDEARILQLPVPPDDFEVVFTTTEMPFDIIDDTTLEIAPLTGLVLSLVSDR